MKNFSLILSILLMMHSASSAENVFDEIEVPPNGAIISSKPTQSGKKYIITVSGEYSMWSQSKNQGRGVDAIWYYDIPEFGNPLLDNLVSILWKNPLYVGSEQEYTLPGVPPNNESIVLNFRNFTGFRINGSPMPEISIDKLNHRYQTTFEGNGSSIKFQIIDSVYNFNSGEVVERYGDNIGSLSVKIIEIPNQGSEGELNICGTSIEKIGDNRYTIKLRASVLTVDSSSSSGLKNSIYNISQIGVILNGRFICPDSLVCDETTSVPVALGLVVDKSASMSLPVSIDSLDYIRMDAAKATMNKIIDNLRNNDNIADSLFIVSLGDKVKIESNWTSDKSYLKGIVNEMQPETGTALYDGILAGLDLLSSYSYSNKALIVLTDGVNTNSNSSYQSLVERLSSNGLNIPIFIVGLSLDRTAPLKQADKLMTGLAESTSNGKFVKFDNLEYLFNGIKTLGEIESNDECCALYFDAYINCDDNAQNEIILLFSDANGVLLQNKFSFNCKELPKIKKDKAMAKDNSNDIKAMPNPFSENTQIVIQSQGYSYATIDIVDIQGNVVKTVYKGFLNAGDNSFIANRNNLAQGVYFLRSYYDGKIHISPIIINN